MTTEHDTCECRACYAQAMGLCEEAIDNWETDNNEESRNDQHQD